MAEIRLLWLPKCISAAATLKSGEANRITTAKSGGGTKTTVIEETISEGQCSYWPLCSGGVRKLLKKLKKQRRKLRWYGGGGRRQSSIQCRYDPLSYSLNFDTSGRGSLADDDDLDYYRFCAFSSRFGVANPSNSSLTN